MNLTEATYLVRYLSKFRLPTGIVSQFPDGEAGGPDYLVVLRLDEVTEPVDFSDLGQALWLLGFKMMRTPSGVINFEKGPKLLDRPMADYDDVEVEEEKVVEFETPEEALAYLNSLRGRIDAEFGGRT